VPSFPPEVIVLVNVPQRMVFAVFGNGVAAYPIAVGRASWPTPLGEFVIASKETNPTWDVPESIREEAPGGADFLIPPHRTLAEIERMAILQTLQRTNWNKQEAAQILGLYRPTLYSKMKKHSIQDAGKAARAAKAS